MFSHLTMAIGFIALFAVILLPSFFELKIIPQIEKKIGKFPAPKKIIFRKKFTKTYQIAAHFFSLILLKLTSETAAHFNHCALCDAHVGLNDVDKSTIIFSVFYYAMLLLLLFMAFYEITLYVHYLMVNL